MTSYWPCSISTTVSHDVTQSTMRDHVRLVGPDGNLVKNKNDGAAFSYVEGRGIWRQSGRQEGKPLPAALRRGEASSPAHEM